MRKFILIRVKNGVTIKKDGKSVFLSEEDINRLHEILSKNFDLNLIRQSNVVNSIADFLTTTYEDQEEGEELIVNITDKDISGMRIKKNTN